MRLGVASVTVTGAGGARILDIEGTCTVKTGGPIREAAQGATRVVGYSEREDPSRVEITNYNRADVEIADLQDAGDSLTVVVVDKGGKILTQRGAWLVEGPTVDVIAGTVPLAFESGSRVEEVTVS